jgi:hypothetical protein
VHDDVDDEDTRTIAKKLRSLVNAHADTDISHLSQFFVIFKDLILVLGHFVNSPFCQPPKSGKKLI